MNVLLTGATGYVGRRLMDRLLNDTNVQLRVFVRNARALDDVQGKNIEVAEGDTFKTETIDHALRGINTAYYLIHSMASKEGDFEDLDRVSAENFRDACVRNGVRRIIYLGGLGSIQNASRHLKSRMETGTILSARPDRIQTVWFRASIIIGSGGASFEIMRHLVQKLPVMIAPRWVNTVTQPIGIADVLDYLVAAKDLRVNGDLVIDIGAERMSFRDMLNGTAEAFGLHRLIISVPFFTPKLSSYWLVFITPVPFRMASALVEGLKYETVLLNDNAVRHFPEITPQPFRRSMREAAGEIERDQVISRWCDTTDGVCSVRECDEISGAVFTESAASALGDVTSDRVFRLVTSIGGENGWFGMNLLWRLRGLLDKLAGGAGTSRGRRKKMGLRIGDAVDFWKVIDLQENKRLLLLSQMSLPGKGWLEFLIYSGTILVTAYFMPRGILGRLYWYAMLPVHKILFTRMAKNIVADARKEHPIDV